MQEAARKAQALSGAGSTTELDWMPATVAPNFIMVESTMDNPSSPSMECAQLLDDFPLRDTENLEAEDDLDDHEDASRDEDIIHNASAVVCWQLPVGVPF